VRARFARECAPLATAYAGALWASERWLGGNRALVARIRRVRRELEREFGLRARAAGPLVGSLLLLALAREARRLRRGWTHEPPTFFEVNEAAARLDRSGAASCRWVEVCPGLPDEPVAQPA